MSKKDEIIKLFKEGIQEKEIANKIGSSLKYVRQVLKDKRTPVIEKELNTENNHKLEIDYIHKEINELKFKIEEQEKIILYLLNNKDGEASNNGSNTIMRIEEVESFIEDIKKDYKHIKDFKVKFTIEWDSSFVKKSQNVIDDKPSFNPIVFYRKEGEKKLKDKLNYLSSEELIQIIKEYVPDLKGYAYKWKNKDKLVQYILDRVKYFAESGKVFYT